MTKQQQVHRYYAYGRPGVSIQEFAIHKADPSAWSVLPLDLGDQKVLSTTLSILKTGPGFIDFLYTQQNNNTI